MIGSANRNYGIDNNMESDVFVLKDKDTLTVAEEDLEVIETSYSNYSDDNKLLPFSGNLKAKENEGAPYSEEGDSKIRFEDEEKNLKTNELSKTIYKTEFFLGRKSASKDEKKSKDFIQMKNWELNRVENYTNFTCIMDPILEDLSYSVTEVMNLSKELSFILQQRTKLWNQYTKSLDANVNASIKSMFSIPMRPVRISRLGLNNTSFEMNNSENYMNTGINSNSGIADAAAMAFGGSINISNTTLSTDVEHNSNGSLSNTLINNNTGGNFNINSSSIPNVSTVLNNNIGNSNKENVCNYIFKSSLVQMNWPNLLNDYFKRESYFLKKLTKSIETDVVNGHLAWISKRYFKNAQGYIKDLKCARKELENMSLSARQSWSKYDQAFKNSQRLDFDISYSNRNKYCDSWYCDQLYRHNVMKFIDSQKKYHNIFILTIENLIELENWRSSSIQLTMNYFLLKQNEFYDFLRKSGDNVCKLVNGDDLVDSDFFNLNSKHSNFDITTTIPGLRPPPIPITESNSRYSKNYLMLSSSNLIKSTSSLLNYPSLPKSSLVVYHGHVELYKRRIFGQWQSAYLILTKDKFLYILDARDDVVMEELLRNDEKPILTICISFNDIKVKENCKGGKRCFGLSLKQKLLTKKIIIRCSNENECFNLTNNIKLMLNKSYEKSNNTHNTLI